MNEIERSSPKDILYQSIPDEKKYMKEVFGKVAKLTPTLDLANVLADTGSGLGIEENEILCARSMPVLRLAAHDFFKASSEVLLTRPLI